jgi:hypothetical protein
VIIFISTLLIACGDSNSLDLTVDEEPGDTALAADEFVQHFTGDLDAMEQNRVIRVLTVYSVGHYYFDNGQAKGFIPEIIRLF